MPDPADYATQFEEHRTHLVSVATRLLGAGTEVDDAVQETWIRYNRAAKDSIENTRGWLTTVIGRICLDMLRSRASRKEDELVQDDLRIDDAPSPEDEAMLKESVGIAMETVIQHLAPSERIAFVLHDVFGVPFDDIAPIVDRTSDATRQLASRARRRVRDSSTRSIDERITVRQRVVEAFFQASRAGDFEALLTVLDPNVTLRPDATALLMGSRNGWISGNLQGAVAVAEQFRGRAEAAQVALLDGQPGGVWANRGKVIVAFMFTITEDVVTGIELVADADRLQAMEIDIIS